MSYSYGPGHTDDLRTAVSDVLTARVHQRIELSGRARLFAAGRRKRVGHRPVGDLVEQCAT